MQALHGPAVVDVVDVVVVVVVIDVVLVELVVTEVVVVTVVSVVVVVLSSVVVVVLVVVLPSVVSVVLVVDVVLLAHASGSHTPEPMLVPPRFAQRSAERCSHLTLPRSASSSSSSSSSVMQQRILPGCGQVSSSQGPLPGITIPCRRSHSSAVTTLQSFSFSSSSKMQHRTRLSLSRS